MSRQGLPRSAGEEKKTVFALLDAFIRDYKAKQHYAI
jgi:hypothetical protein